MPLSTKQVELIASIDRRVKTILANDGDDEAICIAMIEQMPEIRTIMSNVSQKELTLHINKYNGFYRYMKLLERIAQDIQDGTIAVP